MHEINQSLFARICVPPIHVLLVAGAWLLKHEGIHVRTINGELSQDKRSFVLLSKGLRTERIRRFLFSFNTGPAAIANRAFIMSILEETGKQPKLMPGGRAGRGMREHRYYGANDTCQLIWSASMVRSYLNTNNHDLRWSGEKIDAMATNYPDAPTLLLEQVEYPLPTEEQCRSILDALEHYNGTIHPRDRSKINDGMEIFGLQVQCHLEDTGPVRLKLPEVHSPHENPPLSPQAHDTKDQHENV